MILAIRGDANLNLRQLEAFRATMRSGSITEAAEIMHISQPSVSRLIADIERSVGVIFTQWPWAHSNTGGEYLL
jgi:molybdenum-dependent DNA-binding transcriptional regulator ModE